MLQTLAVELQCRVAGFYITIIDARIWACVAKLQARVAKHPLTWCESTVVLLELELSRLHLRCLTPIFSKAKKIVVSVHQAAWNATLGRPLFAVWQGRPPFADPQPKWLHLGDLADSSVFLGQDPIPGDPAHVSLQLTWFGDLSHVFLGITDAPDVSSLYSAITREDFYGDFRFHSAYVDLLDGNVAVDDPMDERRYRWWANGVGLLGSTGLRATHAITQNGDFRSVVMGLIWSTHALVAYVGGVELGRFDFSKSIAGSLRSTTVRLVLLFPKWCGYRSTMVQIRPLDVRMPTTQTAQGTTLIGGAGCGICFAEPCSDMHICMVCSIGCCGAHGGSCLHCGFVTCAHCIYECCRLQGAPAAMRIKRATINTMRYTTRHVHAND